MTATPASDANGVSDEQRSATSADVATEPKDEGGIRRPRDVRVSEPKELKRWYGAPILVADGVAYALIATAIATERAEAMTLTLTLGVPAFALGGPITHAANGHWGRSGLSLLMRAGLPLSGVLLGAGRCSDGGGDCVSGIVTLTMVGMVASSIIDAAALAWEPVEPPRAAVISPSLGFGHGAAWAGASGSF